MGTAASRADRAEKRLAKAKKRATDLDRIKTAKKATADIKKKNPTVGMRAVGAAKKAASAIMGKKKPPNTSAGAPNGQGGSI